jgi:D-alanyl-D-alanine carboxypeptidase
MTSPVWTFLGAAKSRFLTTLAAATVAAALLLGATTPAAATNSRYAALVMNATTGDVIYSRNADSRRYPASLTKLMTLYLLFEAIDRGDLDMDDELSVSSHAAGQPPSKLGVEAGSTITVDEAIQALVVRSANDVAAVVAEALADSEWQFAQAMTARAHEMGMNHTQFRNASGLPNSHQYTTARDLSILATRIVNDFPQHMHYFSQPSFTYNGRTWDAHNHLLDNYEGTTGLKTGYTRASGFNLIATVDRGDISLIGIVMGGRTAARRDAEMERILDLNFGRLEANPYFGSRIMTSEVRPERRPNPGTREAAPAEVLMASVTPDAEPRPRPGDPIPAELASLPAPQPNPLVDGAQRPQDTRARTNDLAALVADTQDLEPSIQPDGDRQHIGDEAAGIELASNDPRLPVGDIDPALERSSLLDNSTDTDWGIDVGQFLDPETADRRLQSIAASIPTQLTWGMAAILPSEGDGERTFDAGFGPMTEDDAVAICSSLAQQGYDCHPVSSVDWEIAIRR